MKQNHINKISFRITSSEFEKLQLRLKEADMKKSEFIRIAVLSKQIIARMTAEERLLLHNLKLLGNNLNQIAKKANQNADFIFLVTDIVRLKDEIDILINQFYKR